MGLPQLSQTALAKTSGGLSYEQNKCIVANLQGEAIRHIPAIETITFVKDLIARAYYQAGQKEPAVQDLVILAADTQEILMSYFPSIKKTELKLAFERGVLGMYGDNFGLSTVTFHRWVKGYMDDQNRQDAIAAYVRERQLHAEPEIKKTAKEQFVDDCRFAEKACQLFLMNGFYEDTANVVFDFLCSAGVIWIGEPEWEAYDLKAQGVLKGRATQRLIERPTERIRVKEYIECVEQQSPILSKNTDGGRWVRTEAKKIALNDFMKGYCGAIIKRVQTLALENHGITI